MSDPLSVTAGVIAIVDATVKILKYLNDVKDAPKQRADCERELATLYSLLVSLKYRLDISVPNRAWNQAVRTLGIENGPFAQYSAILEELHRKITKNNKVVAALKWKFTKDDVSELRSRIQSLKSTIQIVLELDHFELSKATKNDTESIRDDAAEIKRGTVSIYSSILQHEYTQKLQDAFNWISATNYPARQSDFLSRRQPGTGGWFLNSAEFMQWQTEQKSTLLCVGMPGAGKTILAATAIEHLGNNINLAQHGVAYVFCNYKDQMGHGKMDPLAAILKQLVQNKPSAAASLLELHSLHHKHNTRPGEEEITKTLQHVLSDYESTYVVLDALDEYPGKDRMRDRLLSRLFHLQHASDLRLIITSRPIPEVVDAFVGTARIEVRASHADIRLFASERTNRLPKIAQRDTAFVAWVLNTVVDAVDGMFLLAQFYMDRLSETSNKRQIKMLLGSLPRNTEDGSDTRHTYNEVYQDSMGRIETQASLRRNLAKRALSWVTLARRPLTVEELRHALAAEPGDEDLDEDNLSDMEEIITACAGLIVVEKSTDYVRFIHYTTQEFFDGTIQLWYPEAHSYVASTCLAVLRFKQARSLKLKNVPGSSMIDNAVLEAVPFLVYAVLHWADHVKSCQEVLLADVVLFLNDSEVMQKMIIAARTVQARRSITRILWHPKKSTALHVAAAYDHTRILEALLDAIPSETREDLNAADEDGCTPLYVAARQGSLEALKILLKLPNVNINAADTAGRTPLLAAIRNGHRDVVLQLLAHPDIDTELQDRIRQGMIHTAARGGHLELLKIFIDTDKADVDRPDRNGYTPLAEAIRSGHDNIAEYLLSRDDVSLKSQNNLDMNVLHLAAMVGRANVVKLLLKRDDVEVNQRTPNGRTALHFAVRLVNTDVATLIAQAKGVDVEARNNLGMTPLALAVAQSPVSSVAYLIDNLKFDMYTRDYGGRSLILIAAAHSGFDMMKELLKRGFDVNDRDAEGKTPFVYYAERSSSPHWMIWLAQEPGVDLDVKANIPFLSRRLLLQHYRELAKQRTTPRADSPNL